MTKSSFMKIFVLAMGLFVSACQTYSLVSAERASIANKFSVEPAIKWNKKTIDDLVIWTVDGEALQQIQFFSGIKGGKSLFTLRDPSKQRNMPTFNQDMSLLEVREFIESSFKQAGAVNFETKNFEPAKFGSTQGFRIDFTYAHTDGLRKVGFAKGAISDSKFFMIAYHGAKLHYYDKYLKNAEDVIRSLQFVGAT